MNRGVSQVLGSNVKAPNVHFRRHLWQQNSHFAFSLLHMICISHMRKHFCGGNPRPLQTAVQYCRTFEMRLSSTVPSILLIIPLPVLSSAVLSKVLVILSMSNFLPLESKIEFKSRNTNNSGPPMVADCQKLTSTDIITLFNSIQLIVRRCSQLPNDLLNQFYGIDLCTFKFFQR